MTAPDTHALFNALYARYAHDVARRVRGLMNDQEEAADVIQDTWLKVARSLPPPTGEVHWGWLSLIARNAVYDNLRAGMTPARQTVPLFFVTGDGQEEPLPLAELTRDGPSEDTVDLQEILKKLPECERALLALRAMGYPSEEIVTLMARRGYPIE